ncbi:MAG: cytochrome b/b6 domain-containing protein [Acidobacteria bacterium]|nr:cytochrome b/b6 domain-containing protein [Acidobacteriota bacterium]
MTKLLHWAPNLGEREKRAIHVVERGLYLYLLMMPLSGFVFVMAGDFGVHFFNTWHLPKVVGPNDTLALAAQWMHELGAWLLVVLLLAHWTIVARHEPRHRDRYLSRMLPFTHQR